MSHCTLLNPSHVRARRRCRQVVAARRDHRPPNHHHDLCARPDWRMVTMESTTQRFCVLLLCTHKVSRSHMAEGLARAQSQAACDMFSARAEPRMVHPLAIKTMQEIGIDR